MTSTSVPIICFPLTVYRDGQLSGAEFVLAMHFASIARTGLALPSSIPEHLIPGHKAAPSHVEPVHAPAPAHVEAPPLPEHDHAGPPQVLESFGLAPTHSAPAQAEPVHVAAPDHEAREHVAESVADAIVTEAVSDAAVEVLQESQSQHANHVQFDDTPSEAPPPIPDDAPPADDPPPIPDETAPVESSIEPVTEDPAAEVCNCYHPSP